MLHLKYLFIGLLTTGIAVPIAADIGLPFDKDDGCRDGPLEQFGRYLGSWEIQDWQLSKDGQEWTEGAGARWTFSCLGNGTAIQDFWLPNDGGVGTNLRTYNSKTESWDIAWAIKSMPGFAHIEAKEDSIGNIVMHYKSPLPDPLRRITFFSPVDNGWNWTLEISTDNGDTWKEVYRIKATRIDR